MQLALLALGCAASLPLQAFAHAGHHHDESAEPVDVEVLQQKWGTDVREKEVSVWWIERR